MNVMKVPLLELIKKIFAPFPSFPHRREASLFTLLLDPRFHGDDDRATRERSPEKQAFKSCFASILDKRSVPVLFKSVPQFFFRIHHDRAVPGHRFFDGLSGDQAGSERPRPASRPIPGRRRKKHEHPIPYIGISFHVEIIDSFDIVSKRDSFVAEEAFAPMT